MPGRIIGLSKDSENNLAYRMALQTREQHIRRDKATSNICTAQVLLSVIAGMYAVYHGPKGILQIANTIHENTKRLASSLKENGYEIRHDQFFDTIRFGTNGKKINIKDLGVNFRHFNNGDIGISLDETTSQSDIDNLLKLFKCKDKPSDHFTLRESRNSEYLTHEVFNSYHSETEMMRYLKKLETKDLSLNTSMISLAHVL